MISKEDCSEVMTKPRLWPHISEFLIEWFPKGTVEESVLVKLPANDDPLVPSVINTVLLL